MTSRHLMTATALVLGLCGLACSFAPQELLGLAGAPPGTPAVLAVQALGAAWLGLAMLDWMARGAPFGGIYGRPVALGNFLHFAVLAAAFAKAAVATPAAPQVAIATVAALGALAFGRLVFFAAPDGP
jgi:hypothetical protein